MANLNAASQSKSAGWELSNRTEQLKSQTQHEATLIGISKGSNTRGP